MKSDFSNGAMTIFLEGRIDSNNSSQVESELNEIAILDNVDIILDMAQLSYISSSGLRVLLKIKKKTQADIRVTNVSDEIFDIFEVTGFDDIFQVERKMRSISVTGCKKISSALNGVILQLSEDEMVKVFSNSIPLEEIKKERNYAQAAMACGVPTLIPYDVVKCEQGYGIVYEKSEMKSLAHIIFNNLDSLTDYARKLGSLMKDIHEYKVPEGKLPDIKSRYRQWIKDIDDPSDSKITIFNNLINSIPDSDNYVHGDINLNSVMVQDDELLFLDMSGSARGNTLFDLQTLFASLVAIERTQNGYCRKNFGISGDSCRKFWTIFFDTYMDHDQEKIKSMNELLLKYFILKEQVLNKLANKNKVNF